MIGYYAPRDTDEIVTIRLRVPRGEGTFVRDAIEDVADAMNAVEEPTVEIKAVDAGHIVPRVNRGEE